MIIVECVQGTPEWLLARSGKPTASGFDKIVTTKGEPSKSRVKYMYQLAGERVSKSAEETYQSAAMARGVEIEEEARKFYEMIRDVEVQRVGFCLSDCKRYGSSPDGLVGKEGGVEIKCPTMAVHVGYVLEKTMPMDYFQQVQGNLFVTGRAWWDFLSYYPGLPPLLLRVTPDAVFHRYLGAELNAFCGELEQIILRIS